MAEMPPINLTGGTSGTNPLSSFSGGGFKVVKGISGLEIAIGAGVAAAIIYGPKLLKRSKKRG